MARKTAKSGKAGKTLVWVLMGLLVIGLGGFGATNFSGQVNSIGHVGDQPILINDYARALNNEIRAEQQTTGAPITIQQAQSSGLTQRVLSQLVVTAALENEAAQLGLSVGDDRLAEDLRGITAFQGADGTFNRDMYKLALDNVGLTERAFEEKLRGESASTLLQGAVLAGTRLPDTYIDTLLDFAGERRAFTWVALGDSALDTGQPVATEDQLRQWYDQHIADYTAPEARRMTYVWLTPDMIVDSVEVEDDVLRRAYDEQFDAFNLPERRLAERLIFSSDADAQAALDRITAGDATFEDLVEERALELSDIDLGDVTRDDLGAAADAVFGAQVGDVVGPAPSDLGPALFRVNAILNAQTTTFEEAMPDLRDALVLDRARRVIEAQAQEIDNELAAGVTLEALAEDTDLQLGTLDWTGDNSGGIAGYDAFRAAAAEVTAEDYPRISDLGDGGIFALRQDGTIAPKPMTYEEASLMVLADWQADARQQELLAEAEALRGQLAEGTTFEGAGLTPVVEPGLTRTAFGADIPEGLLEKVFDMKAGEVAVLATGDGAVLVRLDQVLKADRDSEGSAQLRQVFGDQAAGDVAQDLFRALSTDIQMRAGVEIDQQALNAVHANFQ